MMIGFAPGRALPAPRPALPPYPERYLLQSWRFDGTNWLLDPRTAPLVFLNGALVDSWSGQALRMRGADKALLALPQTPADSQPIFDERKGAIRLWFSPEWTSLSANGNGPGTEARLIEIGAWSEQSARAWWSISLDATGNYLRLLAHDGAGSVAVLQGPVQWQAGQWHQVALSWSVDNDMTTILHVDLPSCGIGRQRIVSP